MHVDTAAHVRFMLSLSVPEVVGYARQHLAWCREQESDLGWRECYTAQRAA